MPPLTAATLVDQKLYLPDDILVKVNIASMANGLEVRCPILDHHIVEFVAGLPFWMKFKNGIGKILSRQLAIKWLPAVIVKRRKHGFGVPISNWLRSDLGYFADITKRYIKQNQISFRNISWQIVGCKLIVS